MSITFTLLFLFSVSIDCSLAYEVLSSTVRLRCTKVYNGQNVYPAYAYVLIIMHQMKIVLWKNLHFSSQQGDRILSFSFFSSRYAGDHLLAPRPSLGSKKRVNRSKITQPLKFYQLNIFLNFINKTKQIMEFIKTLQNLINSANLTTVFFPTESLIG